MSATAVLGLTALPVRTVRRTVSAKVCTIAPAPAGADPRLRCSRLADRLAQRSSRCFVAGRAVRRGAGRRLAEPALARPDFAPRSLARFRRLSSPLLHAAWPYARPPSWSRWWPRPPRPSPPSPPSPPARPPSQRRRVHPRTTPIARARCRQAQGHFAAGFNALAQRHATLRARRSLTRAPSSLLHLPGAEPAGR